MLSFDQLLEQLEKSPLMDSGLESKGMQVVRKGLSLRNKDDNSFWDDFIQICSNTDGLAELLNVKKEVISSWTAKVKEAIASIEKHDQQTNTSQEDDKLMPTGVNGAVTMNDMGKNPLRNM
jgi:Sec7-like guanine-nucleotide exchange factor